MQGYLHGKQINLVSCDEVECLDAHPEVARVSVVCCIVVPRSSVDQGHPRGVLQGRSAACTGVIGTWRWPVRDLAFKQHLLFSVVSRLPLLARKRSIVVHDCNHPTRGGQICVLQS